MQAGCFNPFTTSLTGRSWQMLTVAKSQLGTGDRHLSCFWIRSVTGTPLHSQAIVLYPHCPFQCQWALISISESHVSRVWWGGTILCMHVTRCGCLPTFYPCPAAPFWPSDKTACPYNGLIMADGNLCHIIKLIVLGCRWLTHIKAFVCSWLNDK